MHYIYASIYCFPESPKNWTKDWWPVNAPPPDNARTAWPSRKCARKGSSVITDNMINWIRNIMFIFCKAVSDSVINPLRTIIQQYGDWYTDRWWVGCYIWYSEEGPGRAEAPSSPLIAVPNVTAHPSTASVPTSYYSMWHYSSLCTLKG